jgi:hypothetical protein
MFCRLIEVGLFLGIIRCVVAGPAPVLAQAAEAIATNDNRQPAGRLQNGVLTLQLELRRGTWHPEGEDGEAIPVYAFAEAGKPLQAPAPLIRVPQGSVPAVAKRQRTRPSGSNAYR